jgi:uncharacterized protein (DUF2062 family)
MATRRIRTPSIKRYWIPACLGLLIGAILLGMLVLGVMYVTLD